MASLLAFITPVGSNDGVNGVSISGGQADNAIYCAVNELGTTFSVANVPLDGVFISSRFGALYNQKALYINGAAITVNLTQPSGALPTLSITMLAENRGPVSRFFPGTVHMTAMGASMAGKEGPFTTAWNKYKTKWLAHPYDLVLSYATSQGFTLPSAAQQTKQRQLVTDLIAAGIWSKLDLFYNFYTNGDANFAKINWKNPGAFQAVGTGHEPTFTPNSGFKGNGTSLFLDTTWQAIGSAVNFRLNDAGFAVDYDTLGIVPVTSFVPCGNDGAGTTWTYMHPNGNTYAAINSHADALVGVTVPSSFCVFSLLNNTFNIFRNGGAVYNNTTYPPSGLGGPWGMVALGNGTAYAFPGIVRMNAVGANFSGKESAFTTAWIAYKSAAAYAEIIDFAITAGVPLPSAQQQAAGEQLIYDLMAMGVWDSFDVFYNFFNDAAAFYFSGINWKNPFASTLSFNGAVAFTPNSGLSGDGISAYIGLGIIPGTGTEKLTLNSGGVFLDVTGVTPGTKALFGALDPGIGSVVFYPSIGGMSVGRVADDTDITWTAPNPADGFWLLERNSPVEVQAYQNYDLRVNSSLPASALPGFEFYLLAANNAAVAQDFSDATISVFALGGSLKQFESRLYQAWETYKARAV